MNKWWQDTREGLKTTPMCRYFLIVGVVFLFSMLFLGVGVLIMWQAVPHLLIALAPFNRWAVEVLGKLGLPAPNFDKFKDRSGFWLVLFSFIQLVVGVAFLAGGGYLATKANFSLLGFTLMMLRR